MYNKKRTKNYKNFLRKNKQNERNINNCVFTESISEPNPWEGPL